MTDRSAVLKELRVIPGVGKAMAEDLYNLGYRSVRDLQDQAPEDMYLRHCAQKGVPVDRCVLYVFRCAVYYASSEPCDPELLKWWNWKDRFR